MSENCFVIVNPAAGHGKARDIYPQIIEQLRTRFQRLDFQLTQAPRDAIHLACQAADNNYDTICCMGGDGTAYEVLNGICQSKRRGEVVMGTIPMGTGNSFLLDFGSNDQDTSLQRIMTGSVKKVDLACATFGEQTRYFRNILGVGFVADVCKRTNEQLKFAGELGYSLGVLWELLTLKNRILKLKIDGVSHQRNNCTLTVSNSKYTGGKMLIAPMASVNDGWLDLILINDTNRRALLKAFQGIFDGSHVNHPQVEVLRGQVIEIETDISRPLMIDGEVDGQTPVKIEVLPGMLQVYV